MKNDAYGLYVQTIQTPRHREGVCVIPTGISVTRTMSSSLDQTTLSASEPDEVVLEALDAY